MTGYTSQNTVRGDPVVFSIFKKSSGTINEVEPGRYPVNCNPTIRKTIGGITICGKKYSYYGELDWNKYYSLIKGFRIKKHIIAYGPFLIIVDSSTEDNFIDIYNRAREVRRSDDNIPFTTHEFPVQLNTESFYYDGYFLYSTTGRRTKSIYVPHLGSVRDYTPKTISFTNGEILLKDGKTVVKYNFSWGGEKLPKRWVVW